MSLSVDTNAVLKANKAKKRRQFMKALFSRKIVLVSAVIVVLIVLVSVVAY